MKKILRSLLSIPIMICIFLAIDLIISLDTFDNSKLIIPDKLTCRIFYSSEAKDPNMTISEHGKEIVLTHTSEIKNIFMDTIDGKFKREGFFLLKGHLAYPRYLFVPEYTDEKYNSLLYYVIDCNGRAVIETLKKTYIGKISPDVVKKIEELTKNAKLTINVTNQ